MTLNCVLFITKLVRKLFKMGNLSIFGFLYLSIFGLGLGRGQMNRQTGAFRNGAS